MSRYIRRTNTHKGRGHARGKCPDCGKLGLGPMKIFKTTTRIFVARHCRYCGAHIGVKS